MILGRRAPCQSLRRRLRRRRGRMRRARAKVSQAAGVQAEEKIDMIITPWKWRNRDTWDDPRE
eukprot:3455326-Pyramimonas_sp.AAC.1